VLGDGIPGISQPGDCPARSGYSTRNESSGACTITPGITALYNRGTATAPNCNTVAGVRNRTWAEAASHFVPKVVVINTAGWEVVDRWINSAPTSTVPDAQWGGPTNGPPTDEYHTAAAYYSSELYNAIKTFRSVGAKVLVTIAPYFDPPEPLPQPSTLPPDLQSLACTWWEPYGATPPSSSGECSSGPWQSPFGASYRRSKVKTDQLIGIVNQVLTTADPQFGFGSDPNVMKFNFKKHFDGPGDVYTSYVCPPPNDFTVAPDAAHNCAVQNPPGVVPAILARAPDNGHLSVAGEFNVLQPYVEPCVQALLNIGGDLSKCG
jgi:hypothetical protein